MEECFRGEGHHDSDWNNECKDSSNWLLVNIKRKSAQKRHIPIYQNCVINFGGEDGESKNYDMKRSGDQKRVDKKKEVKGKR